MGPALGLIELNSVARGVVATDAMVKRAPVELLESHPICPGKYVIIISGGVEEVDEAMKAGLHYARHHLVDYLFLPQADVQIPAAVRGTAVVGQIDAVGVVETFSVASTILASDAAAKAADITLMTIRLAAGLGGKAFFTLTGELHMVEAAMEAALGVIESGLLVHHEIIPAPHADLQANLL